jgi:hypothetical protein
MSPRCPYLGTCPDRYSNSAAFDQIAHRLALVVFVLVSETRKLAAMVIVINTAVVYWVFRGKLHHA